MYIVRMLLGLMSIVLVEFGQIFGTSRSPPILSLDRRLERRVLQRASRQVRERVLALQMPHYHQLRDCVSQGPQPGSRHRRAQEVHGWHSGPAKEPFDRRTAAEEGRRCCSSIIRFLLYTFSVKAD